MTTSASVGPTSPVKSAVPPHTTTRFRAATTNTTNIALDADFEADVAADLYQGVKGDLKKETSSSGNTTSQFHI